MKHWTDGNMNIWKWKQRFIEATAHFSEADLSRMRVCPINPQRVVEMWRQHGCRHDRVVPEEVTYNFLPTLNHRTARWFYTPVAGMETATWGGPEDFEIPDFRCATLAYHGTSIQDGSKVIISGAMKAGVTSIAGHSGICVYSAERKQESLLHATHTLMPHHPEVAACAILELCVDRSKGTQIEPGLWVQPEGTVMVTGVYTHLLPIADLYGPGFHGRYRIHNSVYVTLDSTYIDDEGHLSYYDVDEEYDDYEYSEDYSNAAAEPPDATDTAVL